MPDYPEDPKGVLAAARAYAAASPPVRPGAGQPDDLEAAVTAVFVAIRGDFNARDAAIERAARKAIDAALPHLLDASQLDQALSRIGELEGRLQEAEKALEFYADQDNYRNKPPSGQPYLSDRYAVLADYGQKAVAALAHLRTEEGQ